MHGPYQHALTWSYLEFDLPKPQHPFFKKHTHFTINILLTTAHHRPPPPWPSTPSVDSFSPVSSLPSRNPPSLSPTTISRPRTAPPRRRRPRPPPPRPRRPRPVPQSRWWSAPSSGTGAGTCGSACSTTDSPPSPRSSSNCRSPPTTSYAKCATASCASRSSAPTPPRVPSAPFPSGPPSATVGRPASPRAAAPETASAPSSAPCSASPSAPASSPPASPPTPPRNSCTCAPTSNTSSATLTPSPSTSSTPTSAQARNSAFSCSDPDSPPGAESATSPTSFRFGAFYLFSGTEKRKERKKVWQKRLLENIVFLFSGWSQKVIGFLDFSSDWYLPANVIWVTMVHFAVLIYRSYGQHLSTDFFSTGKIKLLSDYELKEQGSLLIIYRNH